MHVAHGERGGLHMQLPVKTGTVYIAMGQPERESEKKERQLAYSGHLSCRDRKETQQSRRANLIDVKHEGMEV